MNTRFKSSLVHALPGWHVLEAHNKTARDVLLRLYPGKNRRASRLELRLYPDKLQKIFIYLEAPGALPFSADSGDAHAVKLKLKWCLPFFAKSRVAGRLERCHSLFAGRANGEIFNFIADKAGRLGLSPSECCRYYYLRTFSWCKSAFTYEHWIKFEESLPGMNPESRPALPDGAAATFGILLNTTGFPAEYVNRAVESIQAQTYPHWRLYKDAASYHWQKYSHTLFMDADAIMRPQTLACLAGAAAQNADALVIYSDEDQIDGAGRRCNPHFRPGWNQDLFLTRKYFSRPLVFKSAFVEGVELAAFSDEADCLYPHLLRHMPLLNAKTVVRAPHVLFHRHAPNAHAAINPISAASATHGAAPVTQSAASTTHGATPVTQGATSVIHGATPVTQSAASAMQEVSPVIPDATSVIPAQAGIQKNAINLFTPISERAFQADSAHLRDWAAAQNPKARVESDPATQTHRLIWDLPEPAPLVSILVPTRDKMDVLRPCVEGILNITSYHNFELIVLDNASCQADTLAFFREISQRPRVRVLQWNHPFNYSAINNFGASQARGEVLCLCNNDVEPINADWLTEMTRQACRPDIGCVGAKLYYPNGTIQHGGVVMGLDGIAGHAHRHANGRSPGYQGRLLAAQNFSAVTGACLAVRKSIYEAVGGLNEKDLPVAFNDVDFCLRVRELGYRNLWTPHAQLWHREFYSRGRDASQQQKSRAGKEAKYMRTVWNNMIYNDCFYSSNFAVGARVLG